MRQSITTTTALLVARTTALFLITYHFYIGDNAGTTTFSLLYACGLWCAGTGIAYALGIMFSRLWAGIVSAGDLVFAFTLACLGYTLCTLTIVPLASIYWASFGYGMADFGPFGITVALIAVAIFLVRLLTENLPHITPLDVTLHALSLTVATVAIVNNIQTRLRLRKLASGLDLSFILSSASPFTYRFDAWLRHLAKIFGGDDNSICIVLISDADGLPNMHCNRPNLDIQGVNTANILELSTGLSSTFTTIKSQADNASSDSEKASLTHALAPLLGKLHKVGPIESAFIRKLAFGRAYGMMLVVHRIPVDNGLLATMDKVNHAVDDLLARLHEAIRTRRTFLAEAREIARRDLHDGVLQTLAALRMRLSTLSLSAASAEGNLSEELRRTAEIVSLEQARLRTLLDVGIDHNEPVNLIDSLKLCLRTISLQWKIDARMTTDEIALPTDRETAANIDHLVREIVANATRHSISCQINLGLAMKGEMLILTLRNFSPENKSAPVQYLQAGPLASRSLKQRLPWSMVRPIGKT